MIATPIGNLGDITLRALETLKLVDVIACEDTRVTRRLLDRYAVTTSMLAYHEHNAERVRPKLVERLKTGDAVGLVTDAGTPLISDPGFKLVRAAIDAGVPVTALPGPTAMIMALTVGGLPTDRFMFAGFLPNRQTARRRTLEELRALDATLVFYESPRRLAATLADMSDLLGSRDAAVGRELTKRYEEVIRGPIDELAHRYARCSAAARRDCDRCRSAPRTSRSMRLPSMIVLGPSPSRITACAMLSIGSPPIPGCLAGRSIGEP